MPRNRTLLAVPLSLLAFAAPASAAPSELVISRVYGGGGNTAAPLSNDYIELFNRGTASISLDGTSLQYASAAGTGNFGANAGQFTELSGSIVPGEHVLVAEASGGATGAPLPATDIIDPTPIGLAAGAGKVALATGTTSPDCNTLATCTTAGTLDRISDLVGYGTTATATCAPRRASSSSRAARPPRPPRSAARCF